MTTPRMPEKQERANQLLNYFRYAFSQGKLTVIPVVEAATGREEWMIVSKEGDQGYPLALLMLDPVEAAGKYPAMVTGPSDTPLKDELEKRQSEG